MIIAATVLAVLGLGAWAIYKIKKNAQEDLLKFENWTRRNGFILNSTKFWQDGRRVEYVVFRKSGILTAGELEISDVLIPNPEKPRSSFRSQLGEGKLLSLALSLSEKSSHKASVALTSYLRDEGVEGWPIENWENIPGLGIRASMEHIRLLLGNLALMHQFHMATAGSEKAAFPFWQEGKTVNFLAVGEEIKTVFVLTDKIRPEAKDLIARLKALKVKIILITGDSKVPAAKSASRLGLDSFFAELKPEEKTKKIQELKKTGSAVLAVGQNLSEADISLPSFHQNIIEFVVGSRRASRNAALLKALSFRFYRQ